MMDRSVSEYVAVRSIDSQCQGLSWVPAMYKSISLSVAIFYKKPIPSAFPVHFHPNIFQRPCPEDKLRASIPCWLPTNSSSFIWTDNVFYETPQKQATLVRPTS